MRALALILACAPLLMAAQCSTTPERPTIPKVVEVPVTKYVPVPADLARDCTDEAPLRQTVGEAERLANARKVYLDECTKRMRQIRGLPVDPPAAGAGTGSSP